MYTELRMLNINIRSYNLGRSSSAIIQCPFRTFKGQSVPFLSLLHYYAIFRLANDPARFP
jgi:hypothetical protein